MLLTLPPPAEYELVAAPRKEEEAVFLACFRIADVTALISEWTSCKEETPELSLLREPISPDII